MEEAFPDAMEGNGFLYASIVPAEIHPKDRHVAETAIACKANVIVTENLKDFPAEPLANLGIVVQAPDAFLAYQAGLDRELVLRVLAEQASELDYPPMSLDELMNSMATVYPSFVTALRG